MNRDFRLCLRNAADGSRCLEGKRGVEEVEERKEDGHDLWKDDEGGHRGRRMEKKKVRRNKRCVEGLGGYSYGGGYERCLEGRALD